VTAPHHAGEPADGPVIRGVGELPAGTGGPFDNPIGAGGSGAAGGMAAAGVGAEVVGAGVVGAEGVGPDVVGRRLLDAVAVMNRLRSPGGCPWDAEQDHTSLLRYLIEECYELVEAIEHSDQSAIREELGDVLLQVLFHARIAAETPKSDGGFDIDDVAGDLVDKLVRRHPHVFGTRPPASATGGVTGTGTDGDETTAEGIEVSGVIRPVLTAADQQDRWDELKKAERGRSGVLDGVAFGQPATALAAKLGSRAAKFGVQVELPIGDSPADALFRIAYSAGARGEDPESALRTIALAHAATMAEAEQRAAAEQRPAE